MKVLLAADGSKYTKKALAFLTANELAGDDEVVVINVQAAVPPRVKTLVGSAAVTDWHRDEAAKVLDPIEKFLNRHKIAHKARWVVGSPADEIVNVAKREGAQMIVMGTHGHGPVGRALMGSVAQKVVTAAQVPVLLAK
ncbi:universal stress protein [Ramlibacter albus]|uniref:Universal stress protein n=1 Tax=Ramlibacter albus TaxID=2079448 RepID=A0A923S4J2_9BURK|nr:universal stress protein [Ramlibacter albus]MBC5766973.1 universal stress protein [Ramlibacter albus]